MVSDFISYVISTAVKLFAKILCYSLYGIEVTVRVRYTEVMVTFQCIDLDDKNV